MSKVQTLRAFVKQRLTAAAEEIFEQFERTIAEYEEEVCRQQKLLDAVFKPEVRLHRADDQQLLVSQDEWSPSLDQEDPPELPHIKEEQEEPWSSPEGGQLGGLEEFTFSPVPVKSEEDDEEKPQSEKDRDAEYVKTGADGEDCGGSEPDRKFSPDHLQPATHDKTSDSSEPETDDSCSKWEESREPQSGLKPGSDLEGNSGKTSISSSATNFGHMGNLQRRQTVAPFSCLVCGKRYHHRKTFSNHMRLHSKEKTFSCPICKKAFPWRGDIPTHMRIHTREKPFTCPVCGKLFGQKSHLNQHFTVHTGEKRFICSLCGNGFSRQATLIRHSAVHTGEKPFSCTACGKIFALHDNLRRHMTVHTGEKPFSCSVCNKRFTRRQILKKHKCAGEKPQKKMKPQSQSK
ncbi:gastrula zinc finger protein XlCGF28.1-like [Chelmon rostratus]|uniref:gastrula zinc finger protein XlCGF28.1-like n=1 Tax=Chelmon rostratus TaxID=109905 RepID=UPI001BEC2CEC|nr:gastrula zinc finger protein XlCGF28.1-like [Chelmon rostratus]